MERRFRARANVPVEQIVASVAVSQERFSAVLVKAGQCYDTEYELDVETAQYFEQIVGEHVLTMDPVRQLLEQHMSSLLGAVAAGNLEIVSIVYPQLKAVRELADSDQPAADDTFQVFTAARYKNHQSKWKTNGCLVMSPTGLIYERHSKLQSKLAFSLTCKADAFRIMIKVKYLERGTKRVLELLFTQVDQDPRHLSYDVEYSNAIVNRLSQEDVWPFMRRSAWRTDDDETLSVCSQQSFGSAGTGLGSECKYQFEENDGNLCVTVGKKQMQIANFVIPKILARYTSPTSAPLYKVSCLIESEEKIAMLEPSNYKTYVDVFAAFQRVDPDLMTIEMSPAMLVAYLLSIPDKPAKSKLITYWGLQDDGVTFVVANTAYNVQSGSLVRTEDTDYAIWEKTFTSDAVHAIPEFSFPRIMMMPLHCKYAVGYKLINEICVRLFLNNYFPAISVLAWQITGMYYPSMLKGEVGGGVGNPVLYVTGDHGTGKSSAAKMAAALTGYTGPLPSGQTTAPAILRMVTQHSGIPQHFEDPKFGDGDGSWAQRFPVLVRQIYDGSERAVCGKVDTPKSSIAITSNEPMPCLHDTALWSRVIYVPFEPLEGELPDMYLMEDFMGANRLHSAAMFEYYKLGRSPARGYDVCAITDFISFLDEVTCKSRERNNAGWARIGFMMVLLIKVYQGSAEKLFELLQWIAKSCHYQSTRMLSSPSLFDKFLAIVLDIIKRRSSVTHYDSDQCAYYHCFRTLVLIDDVPVLALRLDWWAQYLKRNKLMDTTATQLRDARPMKDSAMRSDVHFYDAQGSKWPPIVDGRAYTEDEMACAGLTVPKPCLVLTMAYVNKFDSARSTMPVDISTVLVSSHRAGIGTYNFVQAICYGDWFGFDSLDEHAFAPFFKTNVALMDEVRPSIERIHTEQQLPHVHYCTSIENMVREFDYDGVCIADLSPCLRIPWFNFKYATDYDSSEESPSKKQCLRTRGGARPRAPPRTPGDNTLPTRPGTIPITTPTTTNRRADELEPEKDQLDTDISLLSAEEVMLLLEEEPSSS